MGEEHVSPSIGLLKKKVSDTIHRIEGVSATVALYREINSMFLDFFQPTASALAVPPIDNPLLHPLAISSCREF